MFSGGSVFLDSPLNETGVAQAKGLLKFLEGEGQSNPHVAIMTGKASRKSVVVTSNLRRCIETATIGLWGRFHEGKDKILLLSDLQEASPNVDTYSLSKPMGLPPLKQLPQVTSPPLSPPRPCCGWEAARAVAAGCRIRRHGQWQGLRAARQS